MVVNVPNDVSLDDMEDMVAEGLENNYYDNCDIAELIAEDVDS